MTERRIVKSTFVIPLAMSVFCWSNPQARAQDMEPRAYSNAPIGTNFLAGGYAYSSGEVSLDPALPVSNVEAKIHTETAGYSRFFALGGRTASASVLVPYLDADISGDVGEESKEITRSGFGDTRIRMALNLIGGPALTPEEFTHRTPATTLGISATVVAPTGQYTSERLINIGANRWAFKPDIGISQPIGDWFIEGSAGVWFFSDNNCFYGCTERSQDPIETFQIHGGYNFIPGLWLAADYTYWEGGQTSIDGVDKDDKQSSSRYGATLSVPFSKSFSGKLAWSNGLTTRVGGDFDTFLVVIQYRWFDS